MFDRRAMMSPSAVAGATALLPGRTLAAVADTPASFDKASFDKGAAL